jgi:hypothetical protein
MFKQKEYNKLADTDYKMEEYVRVPRLGIDNLHKEIIQLQNKLDKIKEYIKETAKKDIEYGFMDKVSDYILADIQSIIESDKL